MAQAIWSHMGAIHLVVRFLPYTFPISELEHEQGCSLAKTILSRFLSHFSTTHLRHWTGLWMLSAILDCREPQDVCTTKLEDLEGTGK